MDIIVSISIKALEKVLDKLFISSAITAALRQLNLRIVGITGREIAR